MPKYRKKPIIIDAVFFTGKNLPELFMFFPELEMKPDPEQIYPDGLTGYLIETLEGTMKLRPADYLVKGIKGEFYPCKPDIFEAIYELVETEK